MGSTVVDFVGIGAQKAATSWLHRQLAAHPQVRFPARKELHFWNRRDGRPAEDWLRHFEPAAPGVVQGEITPAYALLDEPTIRELVAVAPGVRIFYSLRNPMERAWSSALMALERAELVESEVSDGWFVEHFRSKGSLARGDYEGCLRRWRAGVGDEAVLVLWTEAIEADPRASLVGLARHLGVDPDFYATTPDAELGRRIFSGPGTPLRPSLRPVLWSLYRDRIDSLEAYLGRDLSSWRRGFEGAAA